MMQKIKNLLLILFLILPAAGFAQEKSPSDELNEAVARIREIVKKYPEEAQKKIRRKELYQAVKLYFDFKEMARRSLGANWRLLNKTQQEEFVKNFSYLLAHAYVAKLEQAAESKVKVKRELIRGSRALLQTIVKTPSDTVSISYKLMKENSRWVVYDVAVENIGLVNNYRSEFASIIEKEGVEGLLKKVKEKAEKFQ